MMMTTEIESIINSAVLHLHPDKLQECKLLILSNAELNKKAQEGKIYPIRKFLRHYLKLDTLPRGTSTLASQFWLLRGWTYEDAVLRKRNQTSKIDYSKFSPYSSNNEKYKNLSNEQIQYEIRSRRPCNKEFWLKQGLSIEDANKAVFAHQQKASKISNSNFTDHRTSIQINYWLKHGFSEQEALIELQKRQNVVSIESHITRYGVKTGVLKYSRNVGRDRSKIKDKKKCHSNGIMGM